MTNRKAYLQFLVLSTLILLLASCGFTLRGSSNIPDEIKNVYVRSSDPFGAMTKQFQRMLSTSGVKLATTQQDAPLTIDIIRSQFSSLNTTIGGSDQSQQFLLSYSMNFQVMDQKNNLIFGPLTTSIQQHFATTANELLENSSQLPRIKREMRERLASQALYQLSSHNAVKAYQDKQRHKKIDELNSSRNKPHEM